MPERKFKILNLVTGTVYPKLEEIATVNCPTKTGILNNKAEIIKLLQDCDALICHPPVGRIDAEVFDKCPKLKVIGTYSVGYDHLDLEECKKRNIKVGFTPNVLTEVVAETGMTILLAAARKLPQNLKMVKDWPKEWTEWYAYISCGTQIEGSVIGVLGYGRIGSSLIEKLVPFHPKKILYHDVYKRDGPAEYAEFDDLLAESDFVIITVTLDDSTRGKFNTETLLKMKKGAILVNIARGPIVKTMDLYEVLKSGHLGGAALDVIDPEPLPPDHPILTLDNCMVTPHIGSCTYRTRDKMTQLVEDNVYNALNGQKMVAPLVE